MPEPSQPSLLRAIGRWSLTALVINCIIGSGIFGLPSVLAGSLGSASPIAWLLAAAATFLVMACFAEVASRFERTGGVYLYSRTAFGRTTGIAVAWLGWLGRLTAAAANANIFVIYLAEFWPSAKDPAPKFVVLTLLIGFLAVVNYVGVRNGTTVSNFFTVAKLVTLGAFIIAGVAFILHRSAPVALPASGTSSDWLHAVLLLMFAYGGYEAALTPAGEAKDPRRDYPFALFVALALCTVIYTATQWLVVSIVPTGEMSDRPLAAAAQIMVGGWGASFVSLGVLLSSYGLLSANVLGFSRILFAQAEQRDMPSLFARVHPRFQTPHVAIVVFACCVWIFSLLGGFTWNLTISAMARLIYYGSVCAALPVFRCRKDAPAAAFHIPAGNLIAVLAVGTSLLLFPRLDSASWIVLAVVAVVVAVNSVWARGKQRELERM